MNAAVVNVVVEIVQLAVVIFTAAAALRQLHHNRASNEIRALFQAEANFRMPAVASALRYVQTELARRLEDPAYRDELARPGFVDPETHPEMELLNWFSEAGALVQHGAVDARLFLEVYGRLTAHYWALLEPVVALLRRSRGDAQYLSFEYLAVRSREWIANEAAHRTRAKFARIALRDPYLERDAERPA